MNRLKKNSQSFRSWGEWGEVRTDYLEASIQALMNASACCGTIALPEPRRRTIPPGNP